MQLLDIHVYFSSTDWSFSQSDSQSLEEKKLGFRRTEFLISQQTKYKQLITTFPKADGALIF